MRLAFISLLIGLNLAHAMPRTVISDRIVSAANRWSLDPRLVEAIVRVESNFKPKARSHKGATGLMQVMPRTADGVGIHDATNPLDNLMGACQYLRLMMNRYRGNLPLVLAAYNAGPHNVDKFGGIPPFKETRAYVKSILSLYEDAKRMN